MKKIMTVLGICLSGIAVNAQDTRPIYYFKYDSEMFQIAASIFVVGMFMYFIINIMKRIFEHRLKNKIVDKGISENIAQSILATPKPEDNRYAHVKWFAILAGIGIGLMGVYYTEPIGIHSLAIMAFSLSLSFLGYYLFIRKVGK